MQSPIDLVLSHLENVKTQPNGSYLALCPAHEDKHHSLSITEKDNIALLHCHAGCEKEDILLALGLEMKDLFPPSKYKSDKGDIVITFDYKDINANIIYQVCRFEGKKFSQRRPDGKGGWIWNLTGVKTVPYHLHVITRMDNKIPIFITEGEKDVHTLESKGMIATTNAGGAGKWRRDYNQYLKKKKVIIVPDNDDPGREHAHKVALMLFKDKIPCKIITLPGLADKQDVTDWFMLHGGNIETFKKICKTTKKWEKTDSDDIPEGSKKEGLSIPDTVFANAPFRSLGFWKGNHYFIGDHQKQVLEYSPDRLNAKHLMNLASISWWEQNFQYDSKINWNYLANALIQYSNEIGVFDPNMLRGTGAWYDKDRVVLHLGNKLVVNNKPMSILDFETDFIYEYSVKCDISFKDPMTQKESHKVIDIAEKLAWDKPIFGKLFAGWLALAPICGVLEWRPHIFLTGKRGCGKSWIVREIAKQLIGNGCLWVEGDSTGPGIRQALGRNALPVLYDESESKTRIAIERMQAVVELMRQSSSVGGKIFKGTTHGKAMDFHVQSMFLLAAIGVNITDAADTSRISVLSLGQHEIMEKLERFKEIQELVIGTLSNEFCKRFRARIIGLIPVIRTNVVTFSEAIAEHLKERRIGDQYGTLLAGAYSYFSDNEVTAEFAYEWIAKQNWEEEKEEEKESDEWTVLNTILQSVIKISETGEHFERSVVRLIQIVAGIYDQGTTPEDPGTTGVDGQINAERAHSVLKKIGIRVNSEGLGKGTVHFGRSHQGMKKLLRGTPWINSWDKILLRIKDVEKGNPINFETGIKCRTVGMSIDLIFGTE